MKRRDLKPGDCFVYLEPLRLTDAELANSSARPFYPVDGTVMYVPGRKPWIKGARPSPGNYVLLDEALNAEVLVLTTVDDIDV